MSNITIHDVTERARARLGRTYQVTALAPYPARRALSLWQLNRRPFVHGAADLGAGFGFGGDSNLLRRLKMGLAADGADQATLDSLTERDVPTHAGGITARSSALARLPAAISEKIAAAAKKPLPQNWFFEKRPAQKLHAIELAARAAEYEDAGTGGTAELYYPGTANTSPGVFMSTIPAPVRITHISAAISMSLSLGAFYEWSITPPGIGESMGSVVGGASAPRSVTDNGSPIIIACDIPVLAGSVILRASSSALGANDQFVAMLAVSYRRLRLKTTATL